MKKYRIMVSDFDGTLATTDKKITAKTLLTIRDFVKRGGIFVVSTGRMTAGIDHILSAAGLNVLLSAYNGAEIKDLKTNKLLIRRAIDFETTAKVLEKAESSNLNMHCYGDDRFYVSKESRRSFFYSVLTGVKPEVHPVLSEFVREKKLSSSKILAFDDKEKLDAAFPAFKETFKNLEATRSNAEQIDFNLKGVSKGSALKDIAAYYDSDISEILAIGDAGNDLSMLEAAGFSVAMGNAPDYVKAACDGVTSSCDDDGVALAIEKFCI